MLSIDLSNKVALVTGATGVSGSKKLGQVEC